MGSRSEKLFIVCVCDGLDCWRLGGRVAGRLGGWLAVRLGGRPGDWAAGRLGGWMGWLGGWMGYYCHDVSLRVPAGPPLMR